MYIRNLNSHRCQQFESVSASKVFITKQEVECRHGHFEKGTAVVIIKTEFDYDTRTYLVTLRDLYHNKDSVRLEATSEKFEELFKEEESVSKKYKEYREEIERYYAENVAAYDNITKIALMETVIALIGAAVLTFLMFSGAHQTSSSLYQLTTFIGAFECAVLMTTLFTWIYKFYIRHIRKKGNWGGMLTKEAQRRTELAQEVEEMLKEENGDTGK